MSGSSAWGDTRSSSGAPRADAPRRAPDASFSRDDGGGQGRAVPRGSSGGNGGESRTAPRGSSGGDSGSQGRAVPRGEGGASGRGATTQTVDGGGNDRSQGRQRVPVPEYSRPRGGRTPIGTTVERTAETGGGRVLVVPGYYDPYFGYGYRSSFYSRYNYWYPGYGFGLGYFYDPFYDPFMTGYGGYYGGG